MPYLGLLHPEPLPLQQATADPYLHRDTQTQFCLSLGGITGSWCTQGLFEPSECLWWVWSLILNVISSLLPFCWSFPFALGCGIPFLVGSNILLPMVVQQRVVILEFSQEKMSAHLSTLPSSSATLIKLLFAGARNPSFLSNLTFSAVLLCASRAGH